jgi:hypothetical protein
LARRAPDISVEFADAGDHPAVTDLLSRHGRLVLKPTRGTASEGVRMVDDITDIASQVKEQGWLVETYVEGPEFSVETFSTAGVHEIIAIVTQVKSEANSFVEVSHFLPAPGLSSQEAATIRDAVTKALDALELRDGPSHTEVKLRAGKATVIETHNRPAGDGLASLVQITTGIDWRRTSVGWPLGARPDPLDSASAPAAAMTFFIASPGKVVAVNEPPRTFDNAVVDAWGADVTLGDTVNDLQSSRDRVGWALVSGATPDACVDAVRILQDAPVVVTARNGQPDLPAPGRNRPPPA